MAIPKVFKLTEKAMDSKSVSEEVKKFKEWDTATVFDDDGVVLVTTIKPNAEEIRWVGVGFGTEFVDAGEAKFLKTEHY